MGPGTRKLFSIASAPLGAAIDVATAERVVRDLDLVAHEALRQDLAALYSAKNGFYAFESALHMFPLVASGATDLRAWNGSDAWRSSYGEMSAGLLFFGEDAFANQFAVRGHEFVTFEAETGAVEVLAGSLEELCQILLADFEYLTGHPLCREWQIRYGKLKHGNRLGAIRPFVLGGGYNVENLQPVQMPDFLLERARLALKLRALPDGAQIRWPLQ